MFDKNFMFFNFTRKKNFCSRKCWFLLLLPPPPPPPPPLPPPALSLQPCTIISLFLNQSVASCFDFCFRFFYQVSQRAIRGGNNIFFFKIMKFKFIFIDEYNHWNRTPTHTQTHTIIFQRYKSFKKLLKSIGPKIDPWVTQGS